MFGAAAGDIIGSTYEFCETKDKDFELLPIGSDFTDDTVMTVAVAEAFLDEKGERDETIEKALVDSMRRWGMKYPSPKGAYGGMFQMWLFTPDMGPYNSWGNGSAMRVSAAGWLFDTIDETRRKAALSAVVTHNHEEGVKGAEAVASAIFLARNGKTKSEIKKYIEREFSYDLSRTLSEIRPTYSFKGSCQETVPEAIIAFLEGEDTIDSIRNAVSLGGDADTLGAITGSIAEAFWKEDLSHLVRPYLPEEMFEVLSCIFIE